MNCDWIKENVSLYLYQELSDGDRHEFEQHAERCPKCAALVAEERRFQDAMSLVPVEEPSPNLLAAARMRLQEALETTEQSRWQRWTFDLAGWMRQMRFAPALALSLLIVGFASGVMVTWRMQPQLGGSATTTAQKGIPAEASIAGIRSITQDPQTNKIQVTYDTLKPEQTQGSLDDPKIQQLLLYAARNNYNSGVRVDSVNLLAQNPEDQRAREALLFALHYDKNPGVRLKALDALGPYVATDTRVRDAVLEALMGDANAGVRSKAITLLQPVRGDSSVRGVLQKLATQDRSTFIRTESQRVLNTSPQPF
jgi:putative zinc finger protein/HEAT repeat protein